MIRPMSSTRYTSIPALMIAARAQLSWAPLGQTQPITQTSSQSDLSPTADSSFAVRRIHAGRRRSQFSTETRQIEARKLRASLS